MRWEDERYIRLYIKNTPGWCVVPWQARAVLPLVMRVLDRAGIVELGEGGLEELAALVMLPVDVVEIGVSAWIARGTLERREGILVMPKFLEAQEAHASNAQRSREKRARARAIALHPDSDTPRHAATRRDTPRTGDSDTARVDSDTARVATDTPRPKVTQADTLNCAVPSRTEPSRAVLNQDLETPVAPAESTVVLKDPPSVVCEVGAAVPSPGPDLARSPVTKAFALQERPEWIRVYTVAVEDISGIEPWVFPEKQWEDLSSVVVAHCVGTGRRNIPAWIGEDVRDFVDALLSHDESPQFWSGYGPAGLLKWHNAGRPGLKQPDSSSPPDLFAIANARRDAEEAERKANPPTPVTAEERERHIATLRDAGFAMRGFPKATAK